MRPLREFPLQARRAVRFVLCDIDDTLTDDGRLTARAYDALERLATAGLRVVPVTGRPAGWCDLIARLWPVDAVVGENGAFYFAYDRAERRLTRCFWKTQRQRREDRSRLERLEAQILAVVPGAALAADQTFRAADLAIDYREDVLPLPDEAALRIVAIFEAAGAKAKVSSIHVNGWYGDYDKLAMSLRLLEERFGAGPEAAREQVLFVGDSPNDAPMFAHFAHTVGVANVRDFAGRLAAEPAWVTKARGGGGLRRAGGDAAGGALSGPMRLGKLQRRERIIAELRANPAVRVAALARAFGVSTETVRRDLDALSDGGLVSRTYGGAALPAIGVEPSVAERQRKLTRERERIAHRAFELLAPREIILVDCGSTTWHFARRLAVEPLPLTVVTNSLGIASTLGANPALRVVVCPGDYAAAEGGTFGPETLAFLRRFRADKAVIGAGGLTADGPTEVDSGAAWVKRVMLERAGRGILLVDHSKFDQPRYEIICALDELDDLVSDAPPPRALAKAIAQADVTLHVT